jgi:hypothetical protein
LELEEGLKGLDRFVSSVGNVLVGTVGTFMGKKPVGEETRKEKNMEVVQETVKENPVVAPLQVEAVVPKSTADEKVVEEPPSVILQAKKDIVVAPSVAIPQTKRPVEEVSIVDPPSTSAVLESTKEDLPLVVLESSTADKIQKPPLTANEIISSLPTATRETVLSHISSLESLQSETLANVLTDQNILFEEFIRDLVTLHAEDIKVRFFTPNFPES